MSEDSTFARARTSWTASCIFDQCYRQIIWHNVVIRTKPSSSFKVQVFQQLNTEKIYVPVNKFEIENGRQPASASLRDRLADSRLLRLAWPLAHCGLACVGRQAVLPYRLSLHLHHLDRLKTAAVAPWHDGGPTHAAS